MKSAKILWITALFLTGSCAIAQSPNWPTRPIRWIVPNPAGGPLDAAAWRLAEDVGKRLGQPIVIDNRPGATSSIGATVVAKSPADGYTFLLSQSEPLINAPATIKNLPYDPRKDFALITKAVEYNGVLMGNPEVRGEGIRDALQRAKEMKTPLSYGSWGPGSYTHLIGETLSKAGDIQLMHVPYKGGAPAVQDMLAKQISFAFAAPNFAVSAREKGLGKVFAVTGSARAPLLPDVPTFAEQGYADPIFNIAIWVGLSAPVKTPAPILKRMESEIRVVLQEPSLIKYFHDSGAIVTATTAEDFQKEFEEEYTLTTNALKRAGVTPE